MKKQLLIFLLLAPLLGLFMAGMKIYYDLHIQTYDGQEKMFTIKPGETFGSLNYRLYENDFIKSKKLFHRYSQARGIMTDFKSGDYKIEPGTTMYQMIELFLSGRSITFPIAIPEGKNLYEIGQLMEDAGFTSAKEFIKWEKDESYMQELGIDVPTAEGYLFPETYNFSKRASAKRIISTMVNQYHTKTEDLDFSHPVLKNEHEVITLASVVEKETGASWERPMIAGVFMNRLNTNMRLQSDPTIIYGIYEEYKGNLTRRMINQTTPYNTYRIGGLPKGPIANPGLEAIKAVLSPEMHDFTYFVSKNDGTHVFSETYKQHLKAVDYWQKTPANRRGKSWRDLKKEE
jgi:UPF0755 protein